MANLAASAVTVEAVYSLGDKTGKLQGVRKHLKLALSGQGGGTNKIGAAALGLSKIRACGVFITSADKIIPATPSYDGSEVLLAALTEATDANRANPADSSATGRIWVEGLVN